MELLCGVPQKTSGPWNSWATAPLMAPAKDDKKGSFNSRLSRSSSARGDEFCKMFGVGSLRTRRTAVTGTMRSTRSAGAASIYGVTGIAIAPLAADPTRPVAINKHLLPPSPPLFCHPSHDSYSTPLSVVDSFTEYSAGSPLRRSQTLPPSAIKRGSDRSLFAQMDASAKKMNKNLFSIKQSDKENVDQCSSDNLAPRYSIPSRNSNTLPTQNQMNRKICSKFSTEEGPYDIADCQEELSCANFNDSLQFSNENDRWHRMEVDLPNKLSSSLSDNKDCYQEPASNSMTIDNDTYSIISPPSCISTASSADPSGITEGYRMCKRHSLASTSSSSAASSRFTSLLGDDTLYSGGSLSEAGSSVASFSTSTDEGVYSASSVAASSIYSSCGRSSSEAGGPDEACYRCLREVEAGVKLPCRQARSVRSARQLPVTPTLRRLLQMVMY